MFNRCWRWRVLFARRSDGVLSPSQWGSLQDHLVSCSSCRKLAEADEALQAFFNPYTPQMSSHAAAAFDNRVVAAAMVSNVPSTPQASWMFRHWKRLQVNAHALPLNFLAQLGSGAVLAVTLTSFFLLPALHSHPPVSARAAQMLEIQTQDRERAETSIPMESLLQTPTPRAALLWTNPQPGHIRHKANARDGFNAPNMNSPAAPLPAKHKAPDKTKHSRRSALPNTRAYG